MWLGVDPRFFCCHAYFCWMSNLKTFSFLSLLFPSSDCSFIFHPAAWFDEEKAAEESASTSAASEMYSAERQESMRRQVAQLHQREERQQQQQQQTSQECQEWQNIARREKNVSQSAFAQSSSATSSSTRFISVRANNKPITAHVK
jgi:hypothetical protein